MPSFPDNKATARSTVTAGARASRRGGLSLTAPATSGPAPATHKARGRNRLQWLQIQLFLEDMPKRGAA